MTQPLPMGCWGDPGPEAESTRGAHVFQGLSACFCVRMPGRGQPSPGAAAVSSGEHNPHHQHCSHRGDTEGGSVLEQLPQLSPCAPLPSLSMEPSLSHTTKEEWSVSLRLSQASCLPLAQVEG